MKINIWKSLYVFLIVSVLMMTQAFSVFASDVTYGNTVTSNNVGTQVQQETVGNANTGAMIETTVQAQDNSAVYYDNNVVEQNTYGSSDVTYNGAGTQQGGQASQGSSMTGNIEGINSALDGFEFGTGLTINANDNGVKKAFQNILSTILSYVVPAILGVYFVITVLMDWAVAIVPPLEGILPKIKCEWMLSGDVGLAKEKKFFAYMKARMVPVIIFVALIIMVTMDLHIVIGNFLGKTIVYAILQLLNGVKSLLNSFSM